MMQPRDPLFTVLGSTELERDIALIDRVDLEVTITADAMASFYEIGDRRILDHSPNVLGLQRVSD